MYAITRLKAARNVWVVQVARQGKLHYKCFYDLKNGGPRKALAAAVNWRDRVLTTTRALTHREFHAQRRSNNTSGVPGVIFLKSANSPQGQWQARITLHNGRKITESFGVSRFGKRDAFKRAVAARAQMLELVSDRLYLYSSTAKKFAARSTTISGAEISARSPRSNSASTPRTRPSSRSSPPSDNSWRHRNRRRNALSASSRQKRSSG